MSVIVFVWAQLKKLAISRKFQVAVLAGVGWLVGKLGFDISSEELAPAIAPLWLYVFGVALEDFGKGKKVA